MEVVFVGVTVNEGHFFNGKSLVGVVTGVEGSNGKEFVDFVLEVFDDLVEEFDDHEGDSFEDAQIDDVDFIVALVGYLDFRVFFFLFC